jgi:hypothetical protein
MPLLWEAGDRTTAGGIISSNEIVFQTELPYATRITAVKG